MTNPSSSEAAEKCSATSLRSLPSSPTTCSSRTSGTGLNSPHVTAASLPWPCSPPGGNTEQLGFHLGRAVENGVTQEELIEAITHVTLYAGWPKGMSAMGVAKQLFTDNR